MWCARRTLELETTDSQVLWRRRRLRTRPPLAAFAPQASSTLTTTDCFCAGPRPTSEPWPSAVCYMSFLQTADSQLLCAAGFSAPTTGNCFCAAGFSAPTTTSCFCAASSSSGPPFPPTSVWTAAAWVAARPGDNTASPKCWSRSEVRQSPHTTPAWTSHCTRMLRVAR